MDNFIKEMRVHHKNSMMQFQKGILLTNQSLRNVYEDMNKNFDLTYILIRRLNQDILENIFSFLRGMGEANDYPTPLDFKYRAINREMLTGCIRFILLSKLTEEVFGIAELFNVSDFGGTKNIL